ncbi:hypothetical protein [Curtobacterium sp. MCBD17_030]|uniref:hypothetical protein n=1 Tax=Curtobacterium sp. MCBD17_030 TaxID=2175649 RepID=UPI0011B5963C|nr:hypothetical protein [Curtobacterium sp. MCBD17_030]
MSNTNDEWWSRAQQRTDILDLGQWSTWPVDVTPALVALEHAGLPATVETFDTVRLADGRRARVAPAASLRRQPEVDPNEPELLLVPKSSYVAPRTMVEIARASPNVLLVNGSQVWEDGRQIAGERAFQMRGVDRYAVFAVARTLPVASGRIDQLAARTGMSVGRIGDALTILGDAVRHVDIGWEAVDMFALADWAMTYNGPGGIATSWHHPGTVEEQARLLIDAGALVSGAWAAMTPFPGLPYLGRDGNVESGRTRVAFTRTMPDMAALGFTSAVPPKDGPARPKFTVAVPEDDTIFATSNFPAGGITDNTITAATLMHRYHEVDLANQVRGRIHFQADVYYDLIHQLPD